MLLLFGPEKIFWVYENFYRRRPQHNLTTFFLGVLWAPPSFNRLYTYKSTWPNGISFLSEEEEEAVDVSFFHGNGSRNFGPQNEEDVTPTITFRRVVFSLSLCISVSPCWQNDHHFPSNSSLTFCVPNQFLPRIEWKNVSRVDANLEGPHPAPYFSSIYIHTHIPSKEGKSSTNRMWRRKIFFPINRPVFLLKRK